MLNEPVVSRTLRELREQAASEYEGQKLRHLVVEINLLLDIVERQLTKLERDESEG